ncbi:MAG TPA: hypothetical protein VHC20_02745 [Candidatus Paceibacterota bacterium]|nr:hypothetical protein [Candidatus Paceibacterota bacterium]
MSRRLAAALAIVSALATSACTTEDDARASYAQGLEDGADAVQATATSSHKDQHQAVSICINAKYKPDVEDVRSILAIVGVDSVRCTKLIDADYVIELQRQAKPDGNYRVLAVIIDRTGSKPRRNRTIVSAGKLRPHENDDHIAHRLIACNEDFKAELQRGPKK